MAWDLTYLIATAKGTCQLLCSRALNDVKTELDYNTIGSKLLSNDLPLDSG